MMRGAAAMMRGASVCTAARDARGAARNFFEVLGVREAFDVDGAQLAARFKQLQRRWHPDRFHNSPGDQRQLAEHMSATLNVAYSTLRQPHARARHLLRLRAPPGALPGAPGDAPGDAHALDTVLLQPEFLSWVMHFREQIAESAGDRSRMHRLSQQLDGRVRNCLQMLQAAFDTNRLRDAAQHTAELQYYHRMEKAIHDSS